ncbi:uncharacterized protein LOC113670284 [Pocillopora damicornis]|uniref:uncharacterized protein LOC113670284 n=1 Tax=Pocillopora damicornis TaxID=46731 RepID=UPI000F556366|nr:uncharacterized protein LOC113670284 [Pocillopora damicornis]
MKMVFRKLQNVLVLLLCSALLIRFSDAKDFRYKHYTFRKKQRLLEQGEIDVRLTSFKGCVVKQLQDQESKKRG